MSALEQGDIIEIDFTPAVGHEAAKTRPAVVLSVFEFNVRSSLVMVAPITSTDNGYPMHVKVGGEANVNGYVAIESMRSLDVAQRGFRHIGYVDDKTLREMLSRVRAMFALR